MRSGNIRKLVTALLLFLLLFSLQTNALAANVNDVAPTSDVLDVLNNNMGLFDTTENTQRSIQIILILTVLAIAPTILIMMTSFTRIIITLSFIRNAMGTQQMPSNQVLIGLALFLTFFVMSPVIDNINRDAYTPYMNEQITDKEAWDIAVENLRGYMMKYVQRADLQMFASISEQQTGVTYTDPDFNDIGMSVIIPAFITSEIKQAFIFGFVLYIPFIVIDMIVASILMSMGMMMLPPVMISLPFKILLFILVDGWGLIIAGLLRGLIV